MDWFFKKEMHFILKSLIWILYYGLNNYQEMLETGPPKGISTWADWVEIMHPWQLDDTACPNSLTLGNYI